MIGLTERQLRWLLGTIGAGCFLLLLGLEMREEENMNPLDLASEALHLILTIGAAVGVALLVQRVQSQHEQQVALIHDLEIARAEGDGWRSKVQSHLNGLRDEMQRQFDDWGMTAAEREIGLLILKGLSHKEIAILRDTSDATVRQQAQAIYRKANLPGKTAFTAYFLEDLLGTPLKVERGTESGSLH